MILFIDGLVHISTLDNDYYQFDATKQRLIGENSGMIYRLGDKSQNSRGRRSSRTKKWSISV